jgi:hypothetical protein
MLLPSPAPTGSRRLHVERPRSRAHRLAILLMSWLLLSPAAFAQDMITEVVPAGFRSADELALILKPLIPAPGSVSGFQNQLVIRTTPANLAELRQLLRSLDKPPVNLLISVSRTLNSEISRDLARARVAVSGSSGRVQLGAKGAGSKSRSASVTVHRGALAAGADLQRRDSSLHDRSTQRVRMLEGKEAFIQTGNSVPVREQQVIIGGGGVVVSNSTRYEEYGSGFWARARLNGDQVTLDIYPQQRRLRTDGTTSIQRANTSVSGLLGHWIEVGGVSNRSQRTRSSIGSSQRSSTLRQQNIYVMVERLN